jgi:hypothetical protein
MGFRAENEGQCQGLRPGEPVGDRTVGPADKEADDERPAAAPAGA